MTRIEKLLGARAGDEVELGVDLIVTDDWTTPALLAPLEALGCERAAAPVVLVRDHTQPLSSYTGEERARVERLRAVEERFVARYGAELISDRGIQHHVLPSTGRLRPGMLVLGNDSHTPTLGAYGVAAFAAQPTTIAAAIFTGKVVMRVPETLHVHLIGALPAGTSARDASLTLLERLRAGNSAPRLATGKALEFSGPALENLSPAERAVLANATPEAVAATATFPLEGERDSGEVPSDALVLDLGGVWPSVARSGQPSDVVPVDGLPETRVDKVFVGTCAGGTFEEIRDFVEAVEGAEVVVPTIVAPASLEVESRLRAEGLYQRLEAAGTRLLSPGCGPCFGFGVGRLADDEVAVVTGNRNAAGRMGSASAKIHLTSGRTAGIAARTGRLGAGGHAEQRAGSVSSNRLAASHAEGDSRPRIAWPGTGNVVRVHGTVSTDDITPSSVPGIGTSSDPDPAVVRRLLFHHLDASAAERDLAGTVIVADENFGVGSNRASSVRALKLAGVQAVIARSVAPLYAMGARDEGLLVLVLEDDEFYRLAGPNAHVGVSPTNGSVSLGGRSFAVTPASPYELALREAGGIVPYLLRRSPVAAR